MGSVQQLMTSFEFSAVFGLKANQVKSGIYFGGVGESVQDEILAQFGMVRGNLPVKYLGVPLSTRKLNVMQCQPPIKKIMARVESWSAKFLSYAGRIQLIKSVLFSMQTYWCQIF